MAKLIDRAYKTSLDKHSNTSLRAAVLSIALFVMLLLISSCQTINSASSSFGEPSPEEQATETASISSAAIATATPVPTPTPIPVEDIRVVSLLSESGVLSPYDGTALLGVQVAIEQINANGGLLNKNISFEHHDTQSRTSLNNRWAERLLSNPPDLIIVSCDSETAEPILKVAEQNNWLTVSPCAGTLSYANAGFGGNNFSFGVRQDVVGAIAAEVSFEKHGSSALVLRDETSPEALSFCDGFEQRFFELGGRVVLSHSFNYTSLEPVEELLTTENPAAQMVVLCSHIPARADAAPAIISMLRRIGFNAPIVAGPSMDQQNWFSAVGEIGELTLVSYSSTYDNDPVEEVNEVVAATGDFVTSRSAGVATVLGYDAIDGWSRAVLRAQSTDAQRVAAVMSSFYNEPFLSGDISFTSQSRMDSGRLFRVMTISDGALTVEKMITSQDH